MADDAISLANVLRLFSISSSFDRRVRSASCMLSVDVRMDDVSGVGAKYRKLAYSAGTKHPHIAMTVNSPTCRRYVLFPIN
jgi:hypothetical protein